MPSYFYHLKFELYPYPHKQSPTNDASHKIRSTWVPERESDIFSTKVWPTHPLTSKELKGREKCQTDWANAQHYRRTLDNSSSVGSADTQRSGGGSVIDCGPSRASPTCEDEEILAIRPIASSKALHFPTPLPQRKLGDLESAKKDWRFDKVRIESFDMTPTRANSQQRPVHTRGESSGGVTTPTNSQNGMNAGLSSAGVGRVTKAQYEVLEGKNTEVGWGIVHLYRDGEETPALGDLAAKAGAQRVLDDSSSPPSVGGLRMKDDADGETEDCTTLCIPAVPSYLTPSDFLGFVGEKTREQVSHFRMVMTGRMNRYLVLMKFRDNGEARRWRAEWDGKVFNSMEPETCHVTFIKSITFQTPNSSQPNTSFPELSHDPFKPSSSTSTFLKPFPPPTPNLVELPTCPVCLERMDDTTGLLTILCQHVFHCACLQKWKGSGCPVCRHTNRGPSPSSTTPSTYPQDPHNPPFGSGENQLCSVCDCADDLWICLICGNVGCGRYKGGHAKEHWKDSAHNFSLEIETQHVWDYAGDMWVHRLIRDKGDDKIMELPPRGHGRGSDESNGTEEMDLVPREKLEGIGMEYTHLLTSQLESQRVYFEDLVSKAAAKASAASSSAAAASAQTAAAQTRLSALEAENQKLRDEVIVNLEKELAREKKKAERSSEIARGFGNSLREEKKVSEGLMDRIEFLNRGMEKMVGEMGVLKKEREELREENRDLMFSLTAGEKLKEMDLGEEVEGGTVVVPEVKEPSNSKKKGKGRGK